MITLNQIAEFTAAFDNIIDFKSNPIWTSKIEEGQAPFADWRYELQVRSYDGKEVVGGLVGAYTTERVLANHAAGLTAEQIKLILDPQYNMLFQDGIPHMSWNTDRQTVMSAVIKEQGSKITSKSWSETWYRITRTWYRLSCGLVISEKVEEPIPWSSSSRTKYNYTIVNDEDVPKTPTHVAIRIYSDGYDKIGISDHFSGTHDECVEWIRQNCKTNLWALLDIETYRNNYLK